jgi:hypothetical protein
VALLVNEDFVLITASKKTLARNRLIGRRKPAQKSGPSANRRTLRKRAW